MLIKEYRIPLPFTLEEYRVGQMFSTAELSKMETKDGEGVEFITNEDFTGTPLFDNRFSSGVYSYKIYRIASRLPTFIRLLFDSNSMDIHEESWNAYPYCRTIVTNPGYMKDNFSIIIESIHENGRGINENAHLLPPEVLERRSVVTIDIGNDPFTKGDYKKDTDPSRFVSVKTKRGPLKDDWISNANPIMTCYKLVRAEFKWFGLQARIENFIQESEQKLFLRFHRQVFCWIDNWHDLNIDDIYLIEAETKANLFVKMRNPPVEEDEPIQRHFLKSNPDHLLISINVYFQH
ncbi:phosphatidylinositol transfer protein alpha isoform [Halyomorpha halys]|uniref:phosphatidylinositol transfer protein alpha isoform n=1 Tax=Halyomorpha halys TaxID=286706 RepID=UPI0006D4FC67|nr:phosphatidylinositol transfer protein alpha isoform-like [Halyomorpha halys]XP_014294282.1 phosphatidylinositol transfer protein alpha isoform-like [Halyomorpha halys]